jgi:hypothetical protein
MAQRAEVTGKDGTQIPPTLISVAPAACRLASVAVLDLPDQSLVAFTSMDELDRQSAKGRSKLD